MEHVVFLDRAAIKVPIPRPKFPHTWKEWNACAPGEVKERLGKDTTIAVTNKVDITKESIAECPSLKLIASCATGYEQIDVAACSERGIKVCNVVDWSTSAVAEHAISLMLTLARQLPQYIETVRAGNWQKSPSWGVLLQPMPLALRNRTVGIIGYGNIAKRIARVAEALEMKVIIAERRGETSVRPGRVDMEQLIKESDVLVVLCPKTPETTNLIAEKELNSMKSSALLINCARGGIVNETALAAAVKNGVIAGAGVDVLSNEPPRDGNPLLVLDLPNLIVTPHSAWANVDSFQILTDRLIGNMELFVEGQPRDLVN